MQNYRSQIKHAISGFELSCISELISDAYFNKHTITRAVYEKRLTEITKRREVLARTY